MNHGRGNFNEDVRTRVERLNSPIDAEFTLVNETEENVEQVKNLPATLESVKFLRHHKAPENPKYLDAIRDEIALDIELGLDRQYSIDQKKILKLDIDKLTESNNYFQVTGSLLNKLFDIGRLKRMCFFHNIKEGFSKTFISAKIPFTFGILTTVLAVIASSMISAVSHTKTVNGATNILIAFTLVMAVASFILCIVAMSTNNFGRIRFNYRFINVNLIVEGVKLTRVSIPRMAKLKMKEAKDSELFEEFTIAYPKFTDSQNDEASPVMKLDPVILGVTKDSRSFMICWWDIQKDIDKVETHINLLKKFKIS